MTSRRHFIALLPASLLASVTSARRIVPAPRISDHPTPRPGITAAKVLTKDQLGDQYGRRLHQGLFHDPLQRDVEALLASSQERVTGRARVQVRGGAVLVEGVESPFSLMGASDARYGERAAKGTDPRAALGFARILAEPARLHRKAGLTSLGPPGPSPALFSSSSSERGKSQDEEPGWSPAVPGKKRST